MMKVSSIALTEPQGRPGAPLVVLAHSLGTGPLIWDEVVPEIAQKYRVSLMTLPGHGNLEVPPERFTMDELADATAARILPLNSSPVLFAGVSIGGALALTLGLRHPELFAGISNIAAASTMGDASHWQARAEMVREQSTSALVSESASRWFTPEFIANQPELTERILRTLEHIPDEGYARCAEALGTYDISAVLAEISVPVLALGGDSDPVVPVERIEEIAANVPGARSVIIPGASHQPPAEQPIRVAAELVKFFTEAGR